MKAPTGVRSRFGLGLALLVVSGFLLALGALLHLFDRGDIGDVVWSAAGGLGAIFEASKVTEGLLRRRFGVDVIALLALVGTIVVGESLASAVIALMVASGQALENWANGRAQHELKALLERAPRLARRYGPSDELETVPVDEVLPGDRLFVAAGEIVPVDGILMTTAVMDQSILTGESLPVERSVGEAVQSGALNAGAPLELRATATSAESAYAAIVRLVREAEGSEGPFVRLADRYALWFLVVTAIVSSLSWAIGGAQRAVAVLVVATPCPLILAVPIAFVGGLSTAARRGVIIKSGAVLERLARCKTVLIDKTGTLTSGKPQLSNVISAGAVSPDAILHSAGSLEQMSPHVLARAVVAAAGQRAKLSVPSEVQEVFGQGVHGIVEGHLVKVGSAAFVGTTGSEKWVKTVQRRARLNPSALVFVGIDDHLVGVLMLEDPLRPDAVRTIRSLRASGVTRIVMVSGDRGEVAESIGAAIGVDEVLAERSPEEKLDVVRLEREHAPTIMVGDGINDAPALALADVGIAMGARGATAASETADVVLSVDRLDRVGEAREIARRSRTIAVQSVIAGMVLSLGAMGVASVGRLPAVWGALLQEGIDVAVIMNALRTLRRPKSRLRLDSREAAIVERFQREHASIRNDLLAIRRAADGLLLTDRRQAIGGVKSVYRTLVEEVLPHEQAEQDILYPELDRLIGGRDATATMSRGHLEIVHQVHRLGDLLEELGGNDPDEQDVVDLCQLLYGLYGILRLHTAQEDESYLSIWESPIEQATVG